MFQNIFLKKNEGCDSVNAQLKTNNHDRKTTIQSSIGNDGLCDRFNLNSCNDMKELFIRHGAATELLSMARELQADMDNCQDEAIASEFQDRIDALMRSYVQILYNQISKIEGL